MLPFNRCFPDHKMATILVIWCVMMLGCTTAFYFPGSAEVPVNYCEPDLENAENGNDCTVRIYHLSFNLMLSKVVGLFRFGKASLGWIIGLYPPSVSIGY